MARSAGAWARDRDSENFGESIEVNLALYIRKRHNNAILKARIGRLFRRDKPINCFQMLVDLQHAGLTNEDVARLLHVPPSNVRNRWKMGSVPNYNDGQSLIKLHRLVMSLQEEKRKSSNNL